MIWISLLQAPAAGDAAPAAAEGEAAPQQTTWQMLKGFAFRMLMMYMIMSFFRKPAAPPPTTTMDGEGGVIPSAAGPSTNLYNLTTRFVS